MGYEDNDIEKLEYAVDKVMLFKKLLELEINESSFEAVLFNTYLLQKLKL